MSISAAFTVNGNTNPGEHSVAFGATVNLALLSTSGASSIQWSIVGSSHTDVPMPGITPGGSPLGATATFPFMSDPALVGTVGGGEGRSVLVQCLVSDGSDNLREEEEGERWAVSTALVGVPNTGGFVPFCTGEGLTRSLTHGWVPRLNGLIVKPRVKCVQSGAQALTANVPAAIVFGGADTYDSHGMHSPSVNNPRILVVVPGDYRFTWNVKMANNATLRSVLRRDGTTEVAHGTPCDSIAAYHAVSHGSHEDRFAAGQYLEVIATCGSSLSTTPELTHFSAVLL